MPSAAALSAPSCSLSLLRPSLILPDLTLGGCACPALLLPASPSACFHWHPVHTSLASSCSLPCPSSPPPWQALHTSTSMPQRSQRSQPRYWSQAAAHSRQAPTTAPPAPLPLPPPSPSSDPASLTGGRSSNTNRRPAHREALLLLLLLLAAPLLPAPPSLPASPASM